MLGMNNEEFRYYAQWVTVVDHNVTSGSQVRVEALRIRDADTDGFPIVFEHTDPIVVQKMLTILNEG